MALQINDTSYAGEFAANFWLPATFGMDTLMKGAVYPKDNIKKEYTIGRIDFQNPLQARAPQPVTSGTFAIDGKLLVPQDTMLFVTFDPRDFEEHWLANQLSNTLLTRQLPNTAENYMMQLALNRSFEKIETGLWLGSKTYTAPIGSPGNGQLKFFDGFLKQMVNDAAVLKVATPLPLTSGPTTGTNTNILEALNSLITLAVNNKKALLSKPTKFQRMKFFVSIATEQIYQDAIVNLPFKGMAVSMGETPPWKGYQLVVLAGMADDTILFCEGCDDPSSNLYVGMNSMEDNMLELKKLNNPGELYYLKGLMKYGVQYGFSDEIFLFTTLTTGSFNV